MKPTLQDHLVLCDMDNTLLTAAEGLPGCNRTVIRLFVEMGGRFTVATGRPPASIRAALGDIRLSLPAIACNGSLIYDMNSSTVIHRATLDRAQATAAIRAVIAAFPQIGVEVMAGAGEMYVPRSNAYTHRHQVEEQIGSIACPLESIPDGWLKVVFAGAPALIDALVTWARGRHFGTANYFVHTNTVYFEIMPAGVSKASALQQLCVLAGVPEENSVFIGDYYNDLEIMQAAGYAVAVANAPDEVKRAADEVTLCSCSDGGVGEYLYKLVAAVPDPATV